MENILDIYITRQGEEFLIYGEDKSSVTSLDVRSIAVGVDILSTAVGVRIRNPRALHGVLKGIITEDFPKHYIRLKQPPKDLYKQTKKGLYKLVDKKNKGKL